MGTQTQGRRVREREGELWEREGRGGHGSVFMVDVSRFEDHGSRFTIHGS